MWFLRFWVVPPSVLSGSFSPPLLHCKAAHPEQFPLSGLVKKQEAESLEPGGKQDQEWLLIHRTQVIYSWFLCPWLAASGSAVGLVLGGHSPHQGVLVLSQVMTATGLGTWHRMQQYCIWLGAEMRHVSELLCAAKTLCCPQVGECWGKMNIPSRKNWPGTRLWSVFENIYIYVCNVLHNM